MRPGCVQILTLASLTFQRLIKITSLKFLVRVYSRANLAFVIPNSTTNVLDLWINGEITVKSILISDANFALINATFIDSTT